LNPIIPERPADEQPAPPSPGFVVAPEVVAERTAESERIQIAAKVWALITFQDLTHRQAAIDWSRDASARLTALVRSHQRAVERLFIAGLLGWLYLWLV
jgi:hypothetical protein